METGDYYETYDSGGEDEEVPGEIGEGYEETTAISESSDSESEPEDSGFCNNDIGSQELSLLDGPSVLIQPKLDEEDGEDGKSLKFCLVFMTEITCIHSPYCHWQSFQLFRTLSKTCFNYLISSIILS